jgi:hypothetical protein
MVLMLIVKEIGKGMAEGQGFEGATIDKSNRFNHITANI